MPAGDFTKSVAQDIQVRATQYFQEGQRANEFRPELGSVKAILENQSMRTSEVLENGKCVGLKVHWLKDCGADASYSGTVPNAAENCDIPSGKELQSDNKSYTPDVFINDHRTINDDMCKNDYDFVDLMAMSITKAVANIEKKLNERAISFINALPQANKDTATEYKIEGLETEVIAADWDEDIIAEFRTAADINQMNDSVILTGRNLFKEVYTARFDALNDNERDRQAKLNAMGMYFDLRQLEQTVGEKASFVFDPNMLGFYNRTYSSFTPMVDKSKNPRWFWKIASPTLRYRRLMMDGQGRLTTTMVPVEYEVEYQKVCEAVRNSFDGRMVYNHNMVVKFIGSLLGAPEGCGAETGVLKYVNVAAYTNP